MTILPGHFVKIAVYHLLTCRYVYRCQEVYLTRYCVKGPQVPLTTISPGRGPVV